MTKPFPAVASRFFVRALVASVTALVLMLLDRGASRPIVHASPTTIADENTKPGAADWDISGAGDPDIQGFATDISVNVGGTVHFKIAAPDAIAGYKMDVYRLGYYGGAGATLVASNIAPTAAMPQTQPDCLDQMATTGLVDCGNWAESGSWAVPPTAVSGIYVAKLTRHDNGNSSHIVFVVRDDQRIADIVFQTSDTTWQAYNQYPGLNNGGASLYCGGPFSNAGSAYACATRAAKVSYNRPFDTRAHDPQSWLFNAEYPMVRWLEANGYDVKYQSGVDSDRFALSLVGVNKPKAFLSVGHDEYWSGNQRQAVENARNAGVNLAFLSGNEMYWKTRYEPSIDGSNTAYRTLVSYKETLANAKIDPEPGIWTGTWRDPRFAATSDGGRPENGLIGQIFTVNCCSDRIRIPQAMGAMRLWAHTGVSAVAAGGFYQTPEETLGYEWDEDLDNGSRPAGLIHLSSTTLVVPEKLIDFGANVAQGQATHALTLYRHNSGALVFGAGTVQWSWGLDGNHDRGTAPTAHTTDQAMQQATVNLLADMGAQPATPQVGLFAATKSADLAAPISTVVFPAAGATVSSGVGITITGTSADQGGGVVAGVEVSVDGGTTWKAAQGTSLWSFDWTPGPIGSATITVRAIDDSGNLESPGPGNTISIAQSECPCTSIWRPTATPTVSSVADNGAVELGVQFQSDIDGFITGIRFYKGVSNTGTHVGSLWSSSRVLLASAEFTAESPSGWQQVNFSTPVAITANTVYVASYHTNVGGYSADGGYFATTGVNSPPLHALASTAQRPNGLFSYAATSTFPQDSFNATNYWVDVVLATSLSGGDTTPPTVTGMSPPSGATDVGINAAITATFSEPMTASTISASTMVVRNAGGTAIGGTVSYNSGTNTATFAPSATLANSTTYTATISGGSAGVTDLAGNALANNVVWSFTTAAPAACPCSLWNPATTTPPVIDSLDPSAVELGVKFRSDIDGSISGVRFYKSGLNTGTHIANLWTAAGALMATATFVNETPSGWQEVLFDSPVPITGGTTYVASYHTSVGRYYAATNDYFTSASVDSPPLHAPTSLIAGGNGVFSVGSSAFPTQTFRDTNYWVDVVLTTLKPTANDDAATVLEDSGATTIAVLANDTYPDPAQTLSVTSVTQPTNGVAAVSGSAVIYTPNPTFFGGDSFTYTVSDGRGSTATATVNVTVTPVNDTPSFTPGGDVTVLEDAGPQTIVNWARNISAGPANESGQSLNFIVTSSNAALFSAQPAITPDGTLSFTTAANANGSATITVQVHDNGDTANGGSDTSAAQTFTIGVTAVNDAPSFTKGADQIKTGNVGAQTVTNWATNISAGPADEAGQALNFIVSNTNASMFATQPAVASNGTLTYTAANTVGSAIVTVSLHDNGGTLAGGADTSAPQTFTISISKAATTTTVSSSLGQKLKFTAIVAAVAPGMGTPSGTVTFMDGATALGSATLDATGTATFTPPSLSAGAHSITAVYAGAATFTGSTSAVLTQWVGVKPSLAIADASADEGNSGTSPLTFTVTLSSAIDSPVTVNFATVDGTAIAGTDYTFASGTLLFNPRETVKTIIVPLIGNTVFQANRSFTVKLTNAQNADISVSVGKATIVEDDPMPVISISANNSVVEGNAGSTAVALTLTLSGATALQASASYATANVTATAGTDYTASTGTVTFAPGETVKTFVVSVLGDTVAEASEAFTVTITNTTQATIGTKSVMVSIIDDDFTAWVNTSLADFTAGTVDAGAYISQTNNGEVILAPTLGSEFAGPTPDPNWSTSLMTGGAATFGNGGLTIDGASLVGGTSGFGPGSSIEFSAKFSGAAGQNAGFTATGALAAPYAVFGTKAANTLLARSVIAGTPTETPINGYSFNKTHKFRIDWNATTVVYWVDDKQVATHAITTPSQVMMRPTGLDGTVGGGALFLDYMRMTPYAAAGTYTSGVFDAGAVVTWTTMTWTATKPAGTTVLLKYRTGNTPTPDATWTALTTLSASGAALAGSTRYLQFVVQETTSDPSQTAVLNDVTLAFKR
jgi:hypothetical protein